MTIFNANFVLWFIKKKTTRNTENGKSFSESARKNDTESSLYFSVKWKMLNNVDMCYQTISLPKNMIMRLVHNQLLWADNAPHIQRSVASLLASLFEAYWLISMQAYWFITGFPQAYWFISIIDMPFEWQETIPWSDFMGQEPVFSVWTRLSSEKFRVFGNIAGKNQQCRWKLWNFSSIEKVFNRRVGRQKKIVRVLALPPVQCVRAEVSDVKICVDFL